MKVHVHKIPQTAPDDLSGLKQAIASSAIRPDTVVAVLGKTEGNGCVNDFTRGFATQTLDLFFKNLVGPALAERILYIMSGGTEGVLSPHLNVFTCEAAPDNAPRGPGLVLGVGRTRDFAPEELGSLAMVDEVARVVESARKAAGLTVADTHFVQIKCPLLASDVIRAALAEGKTLKTTDTYKSMAYSRAASALGVAVALGEVSRETITEEDIGRNWALFSGVASTSAGIELQHCEILVLGNSPDSASDLRISHSVMQHGLDAAAVRDALSAAGTGEVINVLAKAEADPTGLILGRRHTMLQDSDINHTRMARAVVGAVIASIVSDPMVYVSGGAEHQGPAGGGPVAVIVRKSL
jgi:cyanuric acid amidohydrolase